MTGELNPTFFRGYQRGIFEKYSLGKVIGKGGWGVVRKGRRKSDGLMFAIKVLPKVVHCGESQSVRGKQTHYMQSIKTEIDIMLTLRGSLGVVYLYEVYQDDDNIYLVMEMCSGGHLVKWEGMGKGKLNERLVSRYIKEILQIIVVCHARNIMHRDIKPANFLLLNTSASSPVKVIDFGLSKYYTTKDLPLTASTAEGTPWYLAPEACRGKWFPKTDVWACCIMAFYMLTGTYPFIDRTNTLMPDLAKTLKAICFQDLDLTRKECQVLSPLAIDFLKFSLLEKDVEKRPSAADCLSHPWIQQVEALDPSPLDPTVLQRLQKFSQNGTFKCTVLEHIAREIVSMHFAPDGKRSEHASRVFRERSVRSGRAFYEQTGKMQGSTQTLSLPQATLYSRNLAELLDRIQADKSGCINKLSLYSLLVELGHNIDEQEADEIFNALDISKKGYVKQEDIAASLIDWQDFQDSFKDRWIDMVRRVFEELDGDHDGFLTVQEISAAFEGGLSVPEVDAAVHDVLVEVAARQQQALPDLPETESHQYGSITFDEFMDFMSSENGLRSSLFPDRMRVVEDDQPGEQTCSCCPFFFKNL
ncbi:Calcium-dependent protein kinase 34 [Picochlorum sp. SENEW3]|nr:Calcium-dependent protein kinase 34 [Picochlorum sp. SENEW3]WPT18461.1 Calcium-dependent protein kinase 34 [Picochlorum sp. SENEW3]